jgi:phenylpropionate dioxygenase-like ring-hydroxylating dioxygenase large terminal subunit
VGGPGPGWIRLCDADILPGATVEATLADEDLVVWRTAGGVPCVMDARCPHQWTHLAFQGVVDGEELLCLSHFWRFTTDGSGWKENAYGRRDRKGDIGVRGCLEMDGAIWTRQPESQLDPSPDRSSETSAGG